MSSIDRMLERHGTDWTYELWTKVETLNAYRRLDQSLADAIDIKALRTDTSRERTVVDSLGNERLLDCTVLVRKTYTELADAIQDATSRAPILTDEHGTQFEAVAVGREGEKLGFFRVFLVKMRSTSA